METTDNLVLYYRNKLVIDDFRKLIKFCEEFSEWKYAREEGMKTMMEIKERADKISQLGRKQRNKIIADRVYEKEFDKALAVTREGLEDLNCFLDTVEKLKLFTENDMEHFPKEINLEYAQTVIAAAHLFHSLLQEFKADETNPDIRKLFKDPKLQNVEDMKKQLNKCIETSEKIFDCLGKR